MTRIVWRRLDVPGLEWAEIDRGASSSRLAGSAIVVEDDVSHRLEYAIELDAAGRTRTVRVDAWVGAAAPVRIELQADGQGRWERDGAVVIDSAACLDVDLGFSPLTNSLPIWRLDIAAGGSQDIETAWLRFPGLDLIHGDPDLRAARRPDVALPVGRVRGPGRGRRRGPRRRVRRLLAGRRPRGVTAPIAFAHRGASAYAPENTIEAFRLAIEQGATGLESDAWLAADGVVVLVHDRIIRARGERIDVTRTTSTALAAFGVPTLAALYAELEAAGRAATALSLDLEDPAVAEPAIAAAERAGAIGRLWACHDDVGLLADLRARSAEVRLVCSTRPERVQDGVPALIDRLAARRIDALNMHWRDWDAGLVERCHENGLAAFGWDAQERPAMDRLLALGVDGIYSDFPDRLVAAIAEDAGRA